MIALRVQAQSTSSEVQAEQQVLSEQDFLTSEVIFSSRLFVVTGATDRLWGGTLVSHERMNGRFFMSSATLSAYLAP